MHVMVISRFNNNDMWLQVCLREIITCDWILERKKEEFSKLVYKFSLKKKLRGDILENNVIENKSN